MNKYTDVLVEPSALKAARDEIQQSLEDVAQYFSSTKGRSIYGVDVGYLNSIEQAATPIPFGLLEEFSKFYDKPTAYFFAKNPAPRLLSLPDRRSFMSVGDRSERLSRITLLAIKGARDTQEIAREHMGDIFFASEPNIETINVKDNPLEVAERYRALFKIEHRRRPRSFKSFFEYLRAEVEKLGILVIQSNLNKADEVRGFSIIDSSPYVILINRQDGFEVSHAPRIFTLIHELGHILLRDESICNEGRESRVAQEVFCNKFAAGLLLPPNEVRQVYTEYVNQNKDLSLIQYVEYIREYFRVGFDAAAWRLRDLGIIQSEALVRTAIAEWRARQEAAAAENTFFNKANIEGVVKSRFGEKFTERLINSDSFSPLDIAYILNVNLDQLDRVVRSQRQ